MIVKCVKHCPRNNYVILDLTVMQCTVNEIFHSFSSDYLLAASVYSVRSRLLVVYVWSASVQKPQEPVSGARGKPLQHVHSYRKHNLCGAFIVGLIQRA